MKVHGFCSNKEVKQTLIVVFTAGLGANNSLKSVVIMVT